MAQRMSRLSAVLEKLYGHEPRNDFPIGFWNRNFLARLNFTQPVEPLLGDQGRLPFHIRQLFLHRKWVMSQFFELMQPVEIGLNSYRARADGNTRSAILSQIQSRPSALANRFDGIVVRSDVAADCSFCDFPSDIRAGLAVCGQSQAANPRKSGGLEDANLDLLLCRSVPYL